MYPINFSKFWILPSHSQSLWSPSCWGCWCEPWWCWPAARCCLCLCSTRCCHCTLSRCHEATPGCVTWCDNRDSRDMERDTPRDTGAEHQHMPGAGSGPGTGGSLCYAGQYSWGSLSSGPQSWGVTKSVTHVIIMTHHTLASIVKQTRGGWGEAGQECSCMCVSVDVSICCPPGPQATHQPQAPGQCWPEARGRGRGLAQVSQTRLRSSDWGRGWWAGQAAPEATRFQHWNRINCHWDCVEIQENGE